MSQAQLDRGYRLTELLKQNLNTPMPVEEQVIVVFAGTKGYLDDIPVGDVKRFEAELLEYMRTRKADILDTIRSTGKVPEGDAIADAVAAFGEQFEVSVAATTSDEDQD